MKMKMIKLSNKVIKALRGSSRGVTLIEVLIAMALFGIIAVAFAGGLGTASRAALIGDIRTNAESLVRREMEYIKSQDYSAAPWDYEVTHVYRSRTYSDRPTWWDADNPRLLSNEYAGYTVQVETEALDDPYNGGTLEDIQKITVIVRHEGEEVITLESYKVNRGGAT